ncbi:MAG: NAD(P)H-dependent oxidoreductase [Arachnia sp.]
MRPSIVVVSAGHAPASSTARLGTLLGQECQLAVRQRGAPGHLHHIELRAFAVAVTTALVTGEQTAEVAAAVAAVQQADVLILVTPTINASFSSLLKSFLDVLPPDALRGLPTLIGATGGTQRHTLMLDSVVRPMLGYLRAMVIPSCLFVTADQWQGLAPSDELAARVRSCAQELSRFAPMPAGAA